jgi:hypothetical protein
MRDIRRRLRRADRKRARFDAHHWFASSWGVRLWTALCFGLVSRIWSEAWFVLVADPRSRFSHEMWNGRAIPGGLTLNDIAFAVSISWALLCLLDAIFVATERSAPYRKTRITLLCLLTIYLVAFALLYQRLTMMYLTHGPMAD